MSQAIFLAVIVTTAAFLIISFGTDLRERMIYVFPCIMLTLSWGLMGLVGVHDMTFVMTIILLHMFVFFLMRILKVWGDGDSDMFLLYGAVYAAYAIPVLGTHQMCGYFIGEIIGLLVALIISLVIGFIEARIKKQKIEKGSSIAVVPGFAVVMIVLIIMTIIKR